MSNFVETNKLSIDEGISIDHMNMINKKIFKSSIKIKDILTKDFSDNVISLQENGIPTNVNIQGRLTRFKYQKKMMFGAICDGSETVNLQFIYDFTEEDSEEIKDFVKKASVGASVKLKGILVKSPSKGQAIELKLETCSIISHLREPETYQYGVVMGKRRTIEQNQERMITIRSDTYKRFRDKTLQSIMRIRGSLKYSLYKFFNESGFFQIDTPLTSVSDCEGAGETFQITSLDLNNIKKTDTNDVDYKEDFFGVKTNLTVSGQLEAESIAQTLGKVFTFGPTFRAEKSNTSRHLSEFWMLEPELVFDQELNEERFSSLLDLEESMVKCVIGDILTNNYGDLEHLEKMISPNLIDNLKTFITDRFERITYTKAIELLKECDKTFEENNINWGMDLSSEHEKYLCEELFKKPVFVTNYPSDLKSFYMKQDEDNRTCQAVDLLVPGVGELCGGSMREDNSEILLAMMEKKGVPLSTLQWYIDLRYDGGLPTGGFGLGFERLVCFVTGIKSVRDVIAFPRYYQHI